MFLICRRGRQGTGDQPCALCLGTALRRRQPTPFLALNCNSGAQYTRKATQRGTPKAPSQHPPTAQFPSTRHRKKGGPGRLSFLVSRVFGFWFLGSRPACRKPSPPPQRPSRPLAQALACPCGSMHSGQRLELNRMTPFSTLSGSLGSPKRCGRPPAGERPAWPVGPGCGCMGGGGWLGGQSLLGMALRRVGGTARGRKGGGPGATAG